MSVVEEHPKYAEWREALENFIEACKARDIGDAGPADVQLARVRLDNIISKLD